MRTDCYAPAPGLVLGVRGGRTARRHFAAEYGVVSRDRASACDPDVLIEVDLAARLPRGLPGGSHKTVRWAVDVDAFGDPLSARVVLAGLPRSFGLSLVQGFLVEPLVSLAAARAGLVLLPAAALAPAGGGAVVVLGRSRSGKTSVIARAVAAGHQALGDDQVLVDASGAVRSWPRRLRVYPDLRVTAPSAVRSLPVAKRLRLGVLATAASASSGYVAPSLPLAWRDLGGAAATGPFSVQRLVVVQRGGTAAGVETSALAPTTVVALAREVLREQRSRLHQVLADGARSLLQDTEEREAAILSAAFDGVPSESWTIPGAWSAPAAVSALAARLEVGR